MATGFSTVRLYGEAIALARPDLHIISLPLTFTVILQVAVVSFGPAGIDKAYWRRGGLQFENRRFHLCTERGKKLSRRSPPPVLEHTVGYDLTTAQASNSGARLVHSSSSDEETMV